MHRRERTAQSFTHGLTELTTCDFLISYLLTLMCGRLSPSTGKGTDEVMETLQRTDTTDNDGDGCFTNLCKALKAGIQGRCFIDLHAGSSGAIPEDVQLGESVFILICCRIPLYLHRDTASEHWRLVGEFYIDGYIDGKAVRQRNEGRIIMTTIHLI